MRLVSGAAWSCVVGLDLIGDATNLMRSLRRGAHPLQSALAPVLGGVLGRLGFLAAAGLGLKLLTERVSRNRYETEGRGRAVRSLQLVRSPFRPESGSDKAMEK